MSVLPITNVVTISIASAQTGLGAYQVNNLALLTKETPINAPPLGYAVYRDTLSVATDWGSGSEVFQQAVNIFAQRPNILTGGGNLIIYPMQNVDTLLTATEALQAKIFFGAVIWAGYNPNKAEIEALTAYMQSQGLMTGVSSYLTSDLNPGGLFNDIIAAGQTFARTLLYTKGGAALNARLSMAAYMSRLMSTDFSGSNTTATMQMKDLANVLADDGITQTILNLCQTLGVDCFANIGGLSKVFSNGGAGGNFADNIYNLEWFTFALEVALFNVIAQTSTKIAQTEQGIGKLKNAVIGVLQQAVTNGYVAPGSWQSPDTFGPDPAVLDRNILQTGWYVYSQPVTQQAQVDRAARKAPLIQIAIKLAGAVHSANAIVYINP